jgi:hypothetical protein
MNNTDNTMQPTTHTPGPWFYNRDEGGLYEHNVNVEEGEICQVFDPTGNDEGVKAANARLIAAAPAQRILLDLLRHGLATIAEGDLECDGVMYWFDDSCPDWAAVVNAIGWDHARALLAKATAA